MTVLLAILAVFAAPTRAVAWYAGTAQQCFAADNNDDGVIDAVDMQRATAHYNGGFAWYEYPERYDPLFDIWPNLTPDGHIDIRDLQFVFGRFGMTCPTPWETLGGNYANEWPCVGGAGDPIGTIFLLGGPDAATATQLANDRLGDSGMTTGYGDPIPGIPPFTSRDNFLDNGGCVEGDITRATNGGWHTDLGCLPYCIDSRWHTRCIVHAQPSAYGYWASCTPHWDSGPPPDCPEHYVPAVYNGTENYGGSGYDAARDWLHYQLVQQRGMTFVGPVFFNNTQPRSQCDGTIFSFADSKVNVIVLQ